VGRDPDGGRKETDGAPPAAVRAGSGGALSASPAYRSLLTGAIDYAGLFPPASLSMAEAVSEYGRHRNAPDNWALGRFVVPLSRWSELESHMRDLPSPKVFWPVSLIAAPTDADRIRQIVTDESRLVIEAVECKADSISDATKAAKLVRPGVEVFVEPSSLTAFDAMADALARFGAAAKIRTGGVTADAFPTPRQVLSFLRMCRKARIRFKATAGLHHAVRGEYRLTYESAPTTGVMFGFLNVAMAAALLWFDRSEDVVLRVLEEESLAAFVFTDKGVSWRNERLTLRELDEVRTSFFAGFGSCSFREPMAEIGLEPLPSA